MQSEIFFFGKHNEALFSTFLILAAEMGFFEVPVQRLKIHIVLVPVIQTLADVALEVALVHVT
jgi:hypothetical protein